MGYRTALLFRWSRRDRLTVVVVAVTTAFLVGTALLLGTAATYSETFADPLSNSGTVSYERADGDPPAAGDDRIVLPVATAQIDGESARIVGIPPDAPRVVQNGSKQWQQGRLPTVPPGVDARGPVTGRQRLTATGEAGTATLTVVGQEAGTAFLPGAWYVTNASVVDRLGVDGYLLIDRGGGAALEGSPLVSALSYVLTGLQQVLRALAIGVGAGGILILLVVYSVTRMSVRDRIEAIRVIRSTGGSGWRVGLLFTARAALLVVVGVALGYAASLIVIKAIVNAAVYLSLPIALDVSVTGERVVVVAGVASTLVGMGVLGGALAVYPVATTPPARLGRHSTASPTRPASGRWSRVRSVLSPTVLSWRSLVPTAATLSVFVLTVLLVVSIGGLASPLAGGAGSTGTITEADAPHPLNSRLHPDTARAIRAGGTKASPEIIYAQVRDGQPYMAHGANYSAFAAVTDARLVAGRSPARSDEAVIGRDLARTLDLGVGDRITLGGSVSPGVRQYEVVGSYRARGTLDDLLIVPLESAWGVAIGERRVHMIRVAGEPSVPNGTDRLNRTPAGQPDPATTPTGFRIPAALPASGPPNGTLSVPVVDNGTEPVSGVSVTVDGTTARTGEDGVAVVSLPGTGGNYTIRAEQGRRSATHEIAVVPGSERQLAGSLAITPPTGTVLTTPTVRVELANPWQRTVTRTVRVVGPATTRERQVTLGPGNRTGTGFEVGNGTRIAPGTYSFRLTADGRRLTTAEYTVTGDERLSSAVATSGEFDSGTTIQRSVEGVFGNVQLVLVALVVLAALSTVGSTTATFAQAVHARRQSLGVHRATGATRRQLLRLIMGDVVRIAVPATLLALVVGGTAMVGLERAGWLVFFGFRLSTALPPGLVAGIALGGIALAVVGALVAVGPALTAPPVSLLGTGDRVQRPPITDAPGDDAPEESGATD